MKKAILLAIGLFFCFTSYSVLQAKVDAIFEGVCEECGGTEGTYIWVTVNGGNFTIFIPDDDEGEIVIKSGHSTFIVDTNNPQPSYPFTPEDLLGATSFSQTGNSVVIETENVDPEVEVILVDLTTGMYISSAFKITSLTTEIPTTHLTSGCKYAAVICLNAVGIQVPLRSYNFCVNNI